MTIFEVMAQEALGEAPVEEAPALEDLAEAPAAATHPVAGYKHLLACLVMNRIRSP